MPARSPRCGRKSRTVKPDPHPRLPPKGGSVGRSAAEDGKNSFSGWGCRFCRRKNPKMCARERALCVRQNWGHRAKSCFLPLLIRLARLSRTKPRERACIRCLRRPYALQKEKDRERWRPTCEGRFRAAKPPPTHHGEGEALQCPGFSGGHYASVLCTIFLA